MKTRVYVCVLSNLNSDLAVDGQKFFNFHFFLILLLGSSHLFDQGLGWVQVECAQDISDVKAVDLAGTVEIVDGESEVRPWKF